MEKCQDCGKSYSIVYRVPDLIWAQLTGITNGSGCLCIQCVDNRARESGIYLYWEAAENEYPTKSDT